MNSDERPPVREFEAFGLPFPGTGTLMPVVMQHWHLQVPVIGPRERHEAAGAAVTEVTTQLCQLARLN